ncbi:ABC transporter ATP-binding protein [Paraconexibacter sp.]|uniref:ABC transporter ATP-binding protein n=1 Tax=Paraconexibacter sp. TaxID=2949640 RepID=UPI003562EA86
MPQPPTHAAVPSVAGVAVRLAGVTRVFPGHAPVLDRLDLEVAPGEMILLTGPSGSGKTTLLQLAAGLDRPDAGEVWVGDVLVSDLDSAVDLRRHDVGFVFQLHHLLPSLTAQRNVELPLLAARVPGHERRDRAGAALELVGLAGNADRLPATLSGGERQRVALARAIVHRPRLLLADEPTGALDRVSADLVIALLAALRDAGTTILVVSHDETFARVCDRHLVVEGGTLRPASPAVTA